MAVQQINSSLDFYTYRNDRSWTCNARNFTTHLKSAGTGYGDGRDPNVAGITYDTRRKDITTYRGWHYYDLSGKNWTASSTINSLKLYVTGNTFATATLRVQKSKISFTSAAANVHANTTSTDYSSNTTWHSSNQIEIVLNSTAEGDLSNSGLWLCLRDTNADIRGLINCGKDLNMRSGWRDATSHIKVDFTTPATGYSQIVSGQDPGKIDNIMGISTSNISRVIGV